MGILNSFPLKSAQPETVLHWVTLEGAGAAAPTVKYGGVGMTLARTGLGDYTITFNESPGTLVGSVDGFGSSTPAGAAGFRVEFDDMAANVLTFRIYDETPTLEDLAATETVTLILLFAPYSVGQ